MYAFRFEDGTLDFLNILSLDFGFDTLNRFGGMAKISTRTYLLAKYTRDYLKTLQHFNGSPVCVVYNDEFDSDKEQGPIVTFNLLSVDGNFVGFASVEKVMESFRIQLRTGCFCNTGACQKYLGLSADDMLANLKVREIRGNLIRTF